jgi:SAM-dependent methyltransferase
MGLKELVPWQAKMAAKILLSRISSNYSFWSFLGVFRHGDMDQTSYAFDMFRKHYDRARPRPGFVSLEIGPGDLLASAVLTRAYGGSASVLVDAGDFAKKELKFYRDLVAATRQLDLDVPPIDDVATLDELMTRYDSRYLTHGLESLRTLEAESVDFIYSHAVLEHVRKGDFAETMRQLRRILRKDGVCSHAVDLHDHLGGKLNNLRFRDRVWESDFMARSGFYTNRIGYDEMMSIFREAGFDVEVVRIARFSELPTPRSKLAAEFRGRTDEDLLISHFDVILRPV